MVRTTQMRPGIIPIPNLRRARSRATLPSGAVWTSRNKKALHGDGMRVRSIFWLPCLAIALAGCAAHRPVTPAVATAVTLAGDPAHPGQTQGWVDTRLYFGLGPADTQQNRDKIEAIRAAWKYQTGDQSVLRVTEPAEVSF